MSMTILTFESSSRRELHASSFQPTVAINMNTTFVETALHSSRDACVCLDKGFVFAESVEDVNG